MNLARGNTVEFLKTHEQRLPFVRIDPIGVAVEKNIRMKVDARDAHFESDDLPTEDIIVFHKIVFRGDDRFHMNRAFQDTRRRHR